jgi:hypothetical protein
MSDYYPIVAKAVNALGPNTEETRRRVYDRARAALLLEVHKLVPALDQTEIMAEQFFLELAIGEVEADTQREQRAQSAVGTPSAAFPRSGDLAAPRPHANQNDGKGSTWLRRAHGQGFHRSGKGAAARYQEPFGPPAGESDRQRVRNTWLTELLARASREVENDVQDFTPKRALRCAG